jgi:hypothetical protein
MILSIKSFFNKKQQDYGMDDRKRTLLTILAVGLLATVIGCGFIVVPNIIQDLMPSNVRFDETATNDFYSQFSYDPTTANDQILVVHGAEQGLNVVITCYVVSNPELVLDRIKVQGISYGQFTYSVYGIVAPLPPENEPPSFRFLMQESMTSTEKWYISRTVTPSFDYISTGGTKIHITNEGITVDEILGTINDFLEIPFI